MKKQTCKTCEHWVDSTSECTEYLKNIINDWKIPESMEKTIEKDYEEKNDCEYYNN